MKRKVCFGLVLALVAALSIAPSLMAGILGVGGLSLAVTGPISLPHGTSLVLPTTGTCTADCTWQNDGSCKPASIQWASMQVVVMNPWNGEVVAGPTEIGVNKTLKGGGYDASYNQINPVPATVDAVVTIPKNAKTGQQLMALIYGMDNKSNVLTTAYWGFVSEK
jgi:hypothetical protein